MATKITYDQNVDRNDSEIVETTSTEEQIVCKLPSYVVNGFSNTIIRTQNVLIYTKCNKTFIIADILFLHYVDDDEREQQVA